MNAKILFVDDSPTEHELVSSILKPLGVTLSFANDGESACAKAKLEQPDLILMDIVMPGMNGFEATRMISNDAMTKHIPIIIYTSKEKETDKIWGLRQGAKDYLNKPIEHQTLVFAKELRIILTSLLSIKHWSIRLKRSCKCSYENDFYDHSHGL